jgi:hypothetical protein
MEMKFFAIKIFHKIKCYALEAGLFQPSLRQQGLTRQLRQKTMSLDNLETKDAIEPAWIKYREEVRANILQKDPRNFLNWPAIRSSMFHEPDRLELEYLKSLSQWQSLKSALRETPAGNPRRYPYLLSSSGNYIHNAYVLMKFLNYFNFDIKQTRNIVEFGGGYGSMCRLAYNLGFDGRYVIYDLPEFSLLQEYFLKSWKEEALVSLAPVTGSKPAIALLSTLEDLQKQLENFGGRPDIFIATWSLSESPAELRDKIFRLAGESKYIFIAFRDIFSQIDNVAYFKQFTQLHNNYDWKQEKLEHLPGNFLLAGKRRDA